VKELEHKLAERDAIIGDLLRRVAELERRTASMSTADHNGSRPRIIRAVARGAVPPTASPDPAPQAAPQPQPGAARKSGPGPGQFDVDPEAAERALERALVQTGVLLLPSGSAEFVPSFSFMRREAKVPGEVVLSTSPPGLFVSQNVARRNELEAGATVRIGLPWTSQLEVGLPWRAKETSVVSRVAGLGLREETKDARGFGDLRIAVTKAVVEEGPWRPSLFVGAEWDSDTGQKENGVPLGTGFNEVRASLTGAKRQDPLVFFGGVSYMTSFKKNGIKPGDEIGMTIGTALAVSPETSLRFAFQQAFAGDAKVNGNKIPGSDQNLSVLMLGASSIITKGVLLDLMAGVGLTEDSPEYIVKVAVPVRFSLW
jgi:hypothetical protein